MPSVQVQRVPLDSSAEELRQLFSQFGEVRSLVLTYDGAAEGCALVSYADTAAAEQAADLLDSYPLRGSLLEVQPADPDRFFGRLLTSLLAGESPAAGPGPTTPDEARPPPQSLASGGSRAGGGSVEALQEEMWRLQVELQRQEDGLWGGGWQPEEASDEGWHSPVRRKQKQPQRSARDAAPAAAAGGKGAAADGDTPDTGLWIGWVDLGVSKAELARALSRFGPVLIEHMQPADRLAYDSKRYQWSIARFQSVQHAAAAKKALHKKVLPGVSTNPLKVVFYQPGHGGNGQQ